MKGKSCKNFVLMLTMAMGLVSCKQETASELSSSKHFPYCFLPTAVRDNAARIGNHIGEGVSETVTACATDLACKDGICTMLAKMPVTSLDIQSFPVSPLLKLDIKSKKSGGDVCPPSLDISLGNDKFCLGRIGSVTANVGLSVKPKVEDSGNIEVTTRPSAGFSCKTPVGSVAVKVNDEGIYVGAYRPINKTGQAISNSVKIDKTYKWTDLADSCSSFFCK